MPNNSSNKKARASRKAPNNGKPRYYSAMLLSKLKPYKKNPRHNEEAVEAVVKSIEQFGKIAPIIVNEKLRICAGHTRFKAALERNEKTFPVVVVPGLTGERFKAYNIADNQTASIAQWDTPALAAIIKELQDEGFPTETLGFAEDQLNEILASLEDDSGGLTDPDDVPEPPKKAITKRGDLWLLGDHRLLCGDATKAEDVERLMDGEKADLVLTDPPYCSGGFQEAGRSQGSVGTDAVHKQVANDRLSTRGYMALLKSAIGHVDAPYLYTFTDWRMWVYLFDVVESSGYGVRSMIVWNKGTPGMGRGWRSQHELIMWGTKATAPFDKHASGVGNVIDEPRTGNLLHTTQKPERLVAALTANVPFCKHIVDPFLGSGTTLIAADELNRLCYGMELDPGYCDIAIRRWELFTGKKAVLIRKGKQSKITMPALEGVSA